MRIFIKKMIFIFSIVALKDIFAQNNVYCVVKGTIKVNIIEKHQKL